MTGKIAAISGDITQAITESVRQVLLPAPVITENIRHSLRVTLMPHNGKWPSNKKRLWKSLHNRYNGNCPSVYRFLTN